MKKKSWVVTLFTLIGVAAVLAGVTVAVLNFLKKRAKEELTFDEECFSFGEAKPEENKKVKKAGEVADEIAELVEDTADELKDEFDEDSPEEDDLDI